MTSEQLIQNLQQIIIDKLEYLIDRDYVLLDIPYYNNFGDTLIWEGELEFLKRNCHKLLYQSDCDNYNKNKVLEDSIILLQGGGNFGDLWVRNNDFRKKVITENPNNKIIIFPQTVYYQNEENMLEDAELYSKHNNITICARDSKSYDLLKKHFSNNILLVPDMAFFVNVNKFISTTEEKNRSLFFKRTDKELLSDIKPSFIPDDIDTSDWINPDTKLLNRIAFSRVITSPLYRLNRNILNRYFDFYWSNYRKNQHIRLAVNQINPYEKIYATRLHCCILSILLNKKIFLMDNSYGKNSSFYETWLKELDNVTLKNKDY